MTPVLEEWLALLSRVRRHHGKDAFAGRDHRRHLLKAGFARTEASAFGESAGSPEQTRCYAALFKALLRDWAQTATAEGWADQRTMNSMMAEMDAGAERPDAFFAWMYCAAVAWKRN